MTRETEERTPITESAPESWSRRPVWDYQTRDQGKAVSRRGCDICSFTDTERDISVQVAFIDLGIASVHSISFVDYSRGRASHIRSVIRPSIKTARLPEPSEDDSSLTYFDSSMTASIMRRGSRERILITAPDLELPSGERGFKADMTLRRREGSDCLSILSRSGEGKGFSYTTRYMPLDADGVLFMGDRIENFGKNGLAAMTWSRSRGETREEVLEATMYGREDGHAFGLSLSAISELPNAIICDGHLSKLGCCSFTCSGDPAVSVWLIEEENGRLQLEMKPSAMIQSRENMRIFKGESLQIYGRFSGFVLLDDGSRLNISNAYGSVKKAAGRP